MVLRLPDPRNSGSNNPGATNILRLGSKTGALITLIGDIAKGLLPILAVKTWVSDESLLLASLGLGAILGHIFPIYFKFVGGKGVATALGVFLALTPIVALIQVITWLAFTLGSRYSSLAALVTAMATPLYIWLISQNTYFTVLSTIIAILLVFRHKNNIQRLLNGTETKIKFHK
jgi:glycerol-3-phosphate acyltransferase PlsY